MRACVSVHVRLINFPCKAVHTHLCGVVWLCAGIFPLFFSVRRALDRELQSLDLQVGRQLVMTNSHFANKDQEEILT